MVVVWLIAWFVGIWLAAQLSWTTAVWGTTAVIGFSGLLLFWRLQAGQLKTAVWLMGALWLGGLGGVRYHLAVPDLTAPDHIAAYNDQTLTLIGLVVREPEVRDRTIQLRVQAERLILPDGREQTVSGLVLVQAPRFPVIPYGTRLTLNGRLATPPEDPEFSYKAYLALHNIHSLMSFPQISVVAENEGQAWRQTIYTFKAQAQTTINQLIREPQAALLSGILLGNDKNIPADLAEDFRITGMTHIIAISGFNITILILLFTRVTEPFLRKRPSAIIAIIGIAAYTILVGAEPAVVRAALMGSMYLVGTRFLGRPSQSVALLLFAGFAMTLIRPTTLWEVGFQLSFMATLGLMVYAHPLDQWTRRQLGRWLDGQTLRALMGLLSEGLIITLAAQLLTLPLMGYYFGQLSLVSLPANLLILPAQPGVMVWGGLATLTGMVVPAIGQMLGWIGWLFLSYTIYLVRLFASLPGAVFEVEFTTTTLLLFYALVGGLTWWHKQPPDQRLRWRRAAGRNLSARATAVFALMGLLLTTSWAATRPDGRLHVVFLDVGQGDAIFIQTPSGRQILVDGGLYPSTLQDALSRHMPVGDRSLDWVVATHPDADHVAGLPGVFERYEVAYLLTNGQAEGESPIYTAVLEAAARRETAVVTAIAGQTIFVEDGVRLEVLHPAPAWVVDDRNESSVALRLVYGDFSLLLTGDAESEAEEMMLRGERPLSAMVFKAGHHGSRSSSSLPFLQAVQPQLIVISAGADNRYGHPHAEVLQRAELVGAAVLRTDELGTIALISDGERLWIEAGPK